MIIISRRKAKNSKPKGNKLILAPTDTPAATARSASGRQPRALQATIGCGFTPQGPMEDCLQESRFVLVLLYSKWCRREDNGIFLKTKSRS